MRPTLVIMAAGLGARYGGLKQMVPMDPADQLLIDYAMYDAMRAGFSRIVCIIKEEMEAEFEARVARRVRRCIPLDWVCQRLEDLPAGFPLPPGRTRPWGTTQALLALKGAVEGPFAAINADDYYGPEALKTIYDWLSASHGDAEYAMVGYPVALTLSPYGGVTRGICRVGSAGLLEAIEECRDVREEREGLFHGQDGRRIPIPADAVASMNLWGFPEAVLDRLEGAFRTFLATTRDPLEAECILPESIGALLKAGAVRVRVLPGRSRWFGVTYREDQPLAEAALAALRAEGVYPDALWE